MLWRAPGLAAALQNAAHCVLQSFICIKHVVYSRCGLSLCCDIDPLLWIVVGRSLQGTCCEAAASRNIPCHASFDIQVT